MSKLSKEQVAAVLEALDKALSQEVWGVSNFLGLIGKQLQKIRDNFAESQELGDWNKSTIAHKNEDMRLQSLQDAKMMRVFVALYAADGSNLQPWEHVLLNLPNHVNTRSIYANEEDVINALRNKPNPINQAYLAVYIDPQLVIEQASEKIAVDKLGKPLLALKNKAINFDQYDVFVHQKKIYRFVKGRLVAK